MKIIKVKLIILMSIILIFTTGCADHYKRESVDANVINKEYERRPYPPRDEWYVTIQYKNLYLTFEVNKSDYKIFKIGDSCRVNLVKSYDKNNKLIDKYLEW